MAFALFIHVSVHLFILVLLSAYLGQILQQDKTDYKLLKFRCLL